MQDVSIIKNYFEKHRNQDQAIPMQQYMKNHFLFLGIKTPLRRELMKQFFKETNFLKRELQMEFVHELWKLDEREYQYAALDYLNRSLKKLSAEHLPFLEHLLVTKSWWDTVDSIAPNAVSEIAKRFPEKKNHTIECWATDENMWLRRAAILFQLKYKQNTEEERLYRYIKVNANSKEFFIQKAIGWALREYSKTNPDSVRHFIKENELSKLSIREGSKYI